MQNNFLLPQLAKLVATLFYRIYNGRNNPLDQHCTHLHHLASLIAIHQILTLYKPQKCFTSCTKVRSTSKRLAGVKISVSISCYGPRSWFVLLVKTMFTFSAHSCSLLHISRCCWIVTSASRVAKFSPTADWTLSAVHCNYPTICTGKVSWKIVEDYISTNLYL